MQRALFTEDEIRLATERHVKYLGAAKVSINQLHFDPPLSRGLDPKNVDRLRGIFRKNRCCRLDVDNHIPAIVSRQDLTDALRQVNVPQRSLLTNNPHQLPQLAFAAGQLRALHGRHRVQAGAEVLPPADRWWTVDLYLDVEEYDNQKKPTDGEIYRKIRQYEGEDNEAFRARWFVRLSPNNQDRLDQLDNKRNRRLRRAFDRLLEIPGLWPHGMRISMLHRLIATGCVEEILSYLGHIRDFWSSLVGSDPVAMKKIDVDTVDALQLLAPGKCRTDGKTACGLVLSGQAFAGFGEEERRIVWDRLKDFDGLIPSLYTFFEDFKYLESCAHCIKRLFGPSMLSVWIKMRSMFIPSQGLGAEDSLIQTSESTFRCQRATDAERLDTGYLQVWLYTMRHYPLMPPDPKKADGLLAKPARGKADEGAVYEMAQLARRLGFQSPEIDALVDGSPDHQIARAALLQARKPDRYQYDAQQFDVLVNRIVDCFALAVPHESDTGHDLLADSTVKSHARCGMPRIRTHKQDSPYLFLDRLHANDPDVADTVTTFFVRRCVFFAFFGKPAYPSASIGDDAADPGSPPLSPLFVREDDPPDDHRFIFEERLPGEPSRQEPPGQEIRREGEALRMRHQAPREELARGLVRRRRNRKVRIRRYQSRLRRDVDEEPMELEWLNTGPSDLDMSDQGLASPRTSVEVPQNEPTPVTAMPLVLHHPGSSVGSAEADSSTRCTRISLQPALLGWESGGQSPIEVPHRGDGLGNEMQAIISSQQPSVDDNALSLGGNNGNQRVMDEFIGQLMRAQEEQQRLEEELERERLEELGLSHHEREESLPTHQLQNSPPSLHDDRAVVTQPATQGSTGDRVSLGSSAEDESPPAVEAPASPDLVEISFWRLDREEWRQTDRLQVDPSDPTPVERVARKYLWKNYFLYDTNLRSLGARQCYRAATVDGNNAIFLISEDDKRRIVAEGRLVQDRRLLSSVSRVLDRAESEPRPNKRHRPMEVEKT